MSSRVLAYVDDHLVDEPRKVVQLVADERPGRVHPAVQIGQQPGIVRTLGHGHLQRVVHRVVVAGNRVTPGEPQMRHRLRRQAIASARIRTRGGRSDALGGVEVRQRSIGHVEVHRRRGEMCPVPDRQFAGGAQRREVALEPAHDRKLLACPQMPVFESGAFGHVGRCPKRSVRGIQPVRSLDPTENEQRLAPHVWHVGGPREIDRPPRQSFGLREFHAFEQNLGHRRIDLGPKFGGGVGSRCRAGALGKRERSCVVATGDGGACQRHEQCRSPFTRCLHLDQSLLEQFAERKRVRWFAGRSEDVHEQFLGVECRR